MRPFDYIRARQLRAGRYFRAVIKWFELINRSFTDDDYVCELNVTARPGERNVKKKKIRPLCSGRLVHEKGPTKFRQSATKMMERIICCTRILLLCTTTCAAGAIKNTSCYLTPHHLIRALSKLFTIDSHSSGGC
jgi:hypothetical protein